MWSLTLQRVRRTGGPENFQSSVKKDFFNSIWGKADIKHSSGTFFCGDGETTAAACPFRPGAGVEPDQCRSRDEAGFSAIASSMETAPAMKPALKQIQHTPLLWMLIFVPAVLVLEAVA